MGCSPRQVGPDAQRAGVRSRRPSRVQAGVDEANQQFAQVEQIKKFVLLGEEWLPDSDVLTPTTKLKRRGIHARYTDQIESMYA